MSKGKHHGKKRTESRNRKAPGHAGPVFMRDPLSGIPRDILLKGLVEIGNAHKEKFPAILSQVRDIISSKYPLHTISTLSVYGLFSGMTSSGKLTLLQKSKKISQADVEIVQALALQIPPGMISGTPALPETMQKLFDILPELSQSYGYKRFTEIANEKTDQQKAILALQEQLRLHTQHVRNWGYYKRVVAISKRLYEPLDSLFLQKYGISASNIIAVFEHLLKKAETRVTDRFLKFRSIFAGITVEEMVRRYHACYPDLQDSADEMIEYAKAERLSADNMKAILFSHSDFSLMHDFIFTAPSIAHTIGLETVFPSTIFDKLSYSFGDLSDCKPEYLFMDNPIWRRPLIKFDHDKYFCAIPQVFFSFIFQIFNELCDNDNAMLLAVRDRRSKFLETAIVELFAQSFPESEHTSNYKWNNYENDLLILVDSQLIIVEAKSHAVSWPALRGAPDRAKRHVEELILDPSVQSLRLKNKIMEVLTNPSLRDVLLPKFPFSLDNVKNVLRLSVTLEDFAVMQSYSNLMKDAGWIERDHPVAACVLLADLEIVFDILESTAQKIHYIKRRTEIEFNAKLAGDELTLLGFYLSTGFNIGDAEFSGEPIQLIAMGEKIDEYYVALDSGIQRKKPKMKLTRWWGDIIRKLEQRNIPQWTDMANTFLSFSFPEQVAAERGFKKIKKNVFKNWRQNNHLCSVVMIPNMHKSEALGLYAYRDRMRDERSQRMRNIVSQILENRHVRRGVILGVNVDAEHYPYSSVAVFYADENDSSFG